MARSRNIKPGLFANEVLADLPYPARLLFVGLWTVADRAGRLEDRPKRIRGELFRFDDDTHVEDWLQGLHDLGFIQRYTVDDKRYIQIVKWHLHQNPHKREAQSKIPEAPAITRRVGDVVIPVGAPGVAKLADPPPVEIKDPPPKRRRKRPEPLGSNQFTAGFAAFWAAWPQRKQRDMEGAWREWQAAKLEEFAADLATDVAKRVAQDAEWLRDDFRFAPLPTTYLKNKRWNDALNTTTPERGKRTRTEQSNDAAARDWSAIPPPAKETK